MKIPEKCFRGHPLSQQNVRYSREQGRDRWRCKECDALRRRRRSSTPVERQRGPYERVRPEPFLRWFESYCRRYGLSRKFAAKELGIDEKQIRRAYSPNRAKGESGTFTVALVDKVLLDKDTNIRDLYPELYE